MKTLLSLSLGEDKLSVIEQNFDIVYIFIFFCVDFLSPASLLPENGGGVAGKNRPDCKNLSGSR
jgi:hypothetical protein